MFDRISTTGMNSCETACFIDCRQYSQPPWTRPIGSIRQKWFSIGKRTSNETSFRILLIKEVAQSFTGCFVFCSQFRECHFEFLSFAIAINRSIRSLFAFRNASNGCAPRSLLQLSQLSLRLPSDQFPSFDNGITCSSVAVPRVMVRRQKQHFSVSRPLNSFSRNARLCVEFLPELLVIGFVLQDAGDNRMSYQFRIRRDCRVHIIDSIVMFP